MSVAEMSEHRSDMQNRVGEWYKDDGSMNEYDCQKNRSSLIRVIERLPDCYSDKHLLMTSILFENRTRKVFRIL